MNTEMKFLVCHTIHEFAATANSVEFDELFNQLFESCAKSSSKSVESRRKGNELYIKNGHNRRIHAKILQYYAESVAQAHNGSEELAIAYSNRSAILIHLKKFQDSLADIEKALKITNANELKVKLLCRQAECLVAIQGGKQHNSLEKAKYWLSKVKSTKLSNTLLKTIKKTEKVIEADISYFVNNENRRVKCSNDAVTVNYTQKDGYHLIATRDIHPGEFVLLEDLYVSSLNTRKKYIYCSHCLRICWATIPCNTCSCNMYCSEQCKEEAWTKYHDIECGIHFHTNSKLYYFLHLGIKSLIMGIKEAGNIRKLKAITTKIDFFKGQIVHEVLSVKDCLNSFQNLYSLPVYVSKEVSYEDCTTVTFLLCCLAYKTNILGRKITYMFENKKNEFEDIFFAATVLLKLTSIFRNHCFNVIDNNLKESCQSNFSKNIRFNRCCGRGATISLSSNLIHHKCNNNVHKIFTFNGKLGYFAIDVIKKNSQIYDSYCPNYFLNNKTTRQFLLQDIYGIKCKCLACEQNWDSIIEIKNKPLLKQERNFSSTIKKYEDLMQAFSRKGYSNNFNRECIINTGKDLETLLKHVPDNSYTILLLKLLLISVCEYCYGNCTRIPKSCKNACR